MDLLEHSSDQPLQREEAAARLRELADQLSRHNEIAFTREGVKYTVKVPDQVRFSMEIEIGDDNEIEVEISW
jgi:amphi-Trp domain-containing protein